MWRISPQLLCAAGTSTANLQQFSFAKRFEEMKNDESCPLSGPEYALLLEKVEHYRSLQNTYAVKQSDIERAKRAAHYSGLEFTPKPPTKLTPKSGTA
ncbi:uncharacterized protein TEOVI_000824800 [Trypanosoma equiperdum]|uniref:Uncharacterized protein n=4 Tax=Trypanozoon TaxID=39700 RepID=Q388G7_TRYB2|nr:hypothetical protein, conserved [Trypanosoma brucei gambiense DAL972]XP_827915.1 hypothetical protein, conserved [Trypanosoma brucei brucei TREU927]RHW68938.1 hypothetical protein DPX39_100150700 [Trypanosoma brucei equiperdum]SCU66535.1 hypothetical protein, conserved [Trypanosoma equiperdum]EAN78803.1 hypothetical protein, conserved [Trypanosoma brucei brucei TREU927]CBH16641.1 hypothetical protein, conserved [Trypanosoma brucei gambiense DAL972]|eukprot:XP_011778905.1 hypothetical protein, conserved [Trypanosoma brucei gambiense DAL972]